MSATTASKPKVLVLPGPTLYTRLFAPHVDTRLRDLFDVTFNERDENWTSERLAGSIAPYDALVTSWGSPVITREVLEAAPNLKLVAHSAGSVKGIIKPEVLEHGVQVSSAAIAMAPAVAEFSLLLTMLGLRPVHEYDYGMRRADRHWESQEAYGTGQEIAGSHIGVVGAGMVGRIYIGLVRSLAANVSVYDPYLSDDTAAQLGVTMLTLDELCRTSSTLVIHAPTTPETHHLIDREHLALLPDGAYLVNTARSWIVDQEALLSELESGRIRAALDVYDEEPLSDSHPFRQLPNVLMTPHIAGATLQTRIRQGECVLRDLENVFGGRPLQHGITLDRYDILA